MPASKIGHPEKGRLELFVNGELRQQGDIADVWARPVDAQTALFLGYARVLDGAAAARVLGVVGLEGDAVALRRSIITVAPEPAGGG